MCGLSIPEVAAKFKVDRTTIYRWLARDKEPGDCGLVRRPGSGQAKKKIPKSKLKSILLKPAKKFEYVSALWTIGRLHAVLTKKKKVKISRDTLWRRIREVGLMYSQPEGQTSIEKRHAKREWMREIGSKIRALEKKNNGKTLYVEVSSVVLISLQGYWESGKNATLRQKGKPRQDELTVISAVDQRGKLFFQVFDERVVSTMAIQFLEQLKLVYPKRHLIILIDEASRVFTKKVLAASSSNMDIIGLPSFTQKSPSNPKPSKKNSKKQRDEYAPPWIVESIEVRELVDDFFW